tara:strand:+ start:97 stop:243 length:147 start_codon:yes stop_codon:yes gene_type:complete
VVAEVVEKIQEPLVVEKQVDLVVEHTHEEHLHVVELVEQEILHQFQHL